MFPVAQPSSVIYPQDPDAEMIALGGFSGRRAIMQISTNWFVAASEAKKPGHRPGLCVSADARAFSLVNGWVVADVRPDCSAIGWIDAS